MDYDHVWTSSAGNSTAPYLNNRSYVPSTYPEPLYNVRSGPNSLVNLPCCNSPECSRFTNFSPESCIPNIRNQTAGCQSTESPFSYFKKINYRPPYEVLPFLPSEYHYRSEINRAFCPPHAKWQNNVDIPPNIYKEKCVGKTNNIKSNVKRRRQKNANTKNIIPNFSEQTNHINPPVNYDGRLSLNYASNNENTVRNNYINECNEIPMPIGQNYRIGQTYSHAENNNIRISNNTKMSISNMNATETKNTVKNVNLIPEYKHDSLLNTFSSIKATEETSVLSYTNNDTDFIPGQKNDQHLSILNNEHNINTNVTFGDEITDAVLSNCQPLSNLNLSDCQVTHVTVPENSIFNIQDIQGNMHESTDMENFLFEPIFEGKDENGEDIVILLANSNTQKTNAEEKTEAVIGNHSIETQNNQASRNNLSENATISIEPSLESQTPGVLNEQRGNIILSHIDDYGSEEIVTTTKRKYPKTKNFKKRSVKSRNEKSVESGNQVTGEQYMNSFPNIPSTSMGNGCTSTYSVQNINQSQKIYKRKPSYYRQRMPAWKRRLLWKSSQPLRSLQRTFFKWFMKRVKMENDHLMLSGNFWNMYRIVVTQIGGNVLRTMYNILPALVRNSEVSAQRSGSYLSKKRLQVKFLAKMKK